MSSVVLLSGGMDSATALAHAIAQDPKVVGISFNYGQRHVKELEMAKALCDHYEKRHIVIDLRSIGQHLKSSLIAGSSTDIPVGVYDQENMALTVVPNRNAIMVNIAAGICESLGYEKVVIAVHSGDHAIYRDCRPEWVAAMRTSIALACPTVSLEAPFLFTTKDGIAKLGDRLGVPFFDMTWSCYNGRKIHCGTCGTCTERIEAFYLAGVDDYTEYEDYAGGMKLLEEAGKL